MVCKVKDDDTGKDAIIGGITVDLSHVATNPGEFLNKYLSLRNEDGKPKAGFIYVQAVF